MALSELLYYPPFVAVVGLGFLLAAGFVVFIVHQRRKINKLRKGIQAVPPAISGEKMARAPRPPEYGGQRDAYGSPSENAPSPESQTEQPSAASAARYEAPAATVPLVPILPVPHTAAKQPVIPSEEQPSAILAEPDSQVRVPEETIPPPPDAIAVRPEIPTEAPFPAYHGQGLDQPAEPPPAPHFRTFGRDSAIWADFLRAVLIVLACLVAIGLVLIALPQRTFDRMTDNIRYRNSPPLQQEKVAFLFLGDEIKDNQFHIRGAIRNISTEPIEQLDATIRLYAPDGTLLETAVVRMDSEQITPDAVATFHLTYPEYHSQFGSFSVDFKLRNGNSVPYKDMRSVRARE